MFEERRIKILTIFLLLFLFLSSTSVQTQIIEQRFDSSVLVSHDDIIREGIQAIRIEQNKKKTSFDLLCDLERWYNLHPLIEYASLLGTSITVKFVDGSNTVVMDPSLEKDEVFLDFIHPFLNERYGTEKSNTAVILNVAEYMYGHYQCQRIITTLLKHDYSIRYLANQAVNLDCIKNNLSADIIYMNTHAGYFDVDGDHQADAVVIATGEFWTNETEQKYAFDYQNKLIVKGMVGDQSFIAFTPAFIEQYYAPGGFSDSLVFMATCYALYDTSMAQMFLDAGASVYMGWSQNTVFWTNSKTSVNAFRLLSYGLTVQQVCRLIQSGGFYNWLFHSKLIYYGDGDHRIP
jgi:hypothetical protein